MSNPCFPLLPSPLPKGGRWGRLFPSLSLASTSLVSFLLLPRVAFSSTSLELYDRQDAEREATTEEPQPLSLLYLHVSNQSQDRGLGMTNCSFSSISLCAEAFSPTPPAGLSLPLSPLWHQGQPDHMDKQLKGSRFYNNSSCTLKILFHKQRWQEKVYPRICAKTSESDLAR